MSRSSLRIIGVVFWVGAIAVALAATRKQTVRAAADHATATDYLFRGASEVEVVDISGRVRRNDPVFLQHADGTWSQVGHIRSVSAKSPDHFLMSWYADSVEPSRCELTAYQTSGQLQEVLTTMFPPQKREQIRSRLETAFRTHGQEMMQSLVPLVQQSLARSMPVIEEEFRESTKRHRGEIDELARRWNEELIDERLVPLARREVMPIVRRHGQPIAETIGRQLWDRASIWRFGWRAAYDRSPLPRRDLVQQEWDRFVEEEAIPVFDQHMDEIVAAVQRTIADITANQTVKDELSDVASSLVTDPQAMELLRVLLTESVVKNQKLHEVWREVWSSAEARSALQLAGDRLEPVVRQIGDDLFGSEQEGINPDFARVLRNQILGKDRRWIVALPRTVDATETALTISTSDRSMPYPVVYVADRRETSGGEP